MRSLWAYIEGDGWPSPPFHGGKQLQFGCLGQVWHFGPHRWTFAPPELLDAHLNSLQHVCTCYLGPMGSLWLYIEGMDGLCLLFAGTNSSHLAAWARSGTLDPFDGRLLLQNFWMQVNFLQHV